MSAPPYPCCRRYGFPFVYESYLYHATRSDHRHNLSLYFYLLYLDSSAPLKGLSVALLLPQLVGTLLVGCFFAKKHLEAALCLQTIAFVALNKVCTSQYFLWWLCLLPFAVASTDMSRKTVRDVVVAIVFFQLSCFLWLFFAYKLEFEGHPVFLQLMLASVVFFASQMHLVTLVCSRIRANDKAVKY
ncbi:GPI mannosyltransferase [Cyclospora cayetanensis]|uniref:GPI mannosyltransferase 1 n=1 Tax=Cyclospora cayetanensis TaxID=88456 RepID=A0A1D3D046_9EIME|nr:GPI mannosyltransferase [Cyclospora cayetanensis]